MRMSEEIKNLLKKMPFIPLVTQGKEGPHLVVMGKGFAMDDETVAFFWLEAEQNQRKYQEQWDPPDRYCLGKEELRVQTGRVWPYRDRG